MRVARLSDRGVVEVSGDEARTFLDRIVTCDMDTVVPGTARFGALLSPQGKILADFIASVGEAEGSVRFSLDVPRACAADFVRRLNLYRLRAKVTVADRSGELAVVAGEAGATVPPGVAGHHVDPRLDALGWRAILSAGAAGELGGEAGAETAWDRRRIGLGVPEAGRDFPFGDTFPHEALMDQLAGVDFGKGCYVGQEVVSRMQHRGTARTRFVSLAYDDGVPAPGAEVRAGDALLGRTGEASDGRGLATIRLDRAADALAAGETIRAGGHAARLIKPGWVRFPYPGESPASLR